MRVERLHGTRAQILGVVGYPLSLSLSPPMQSAAFKALNLPYTYHRFPVHLHALKDLVPGMKALDFLGANVTIPFKEKIIPYLDKVKPLASEVGAVNTLQFLSRGGKSKGSRRHVVGWNTDVEGFLRAFREEFDTTPAGMRVVLLGSGGAARAVVWGLMQSGAGEISLFCRNRKKGERMISQPCPGKGGAKSSRSRSQVQLFSLAERGKLTSLCREADLIVNATPLGGIDHPGAFPLPTADLICDHHLVYDLVYLPLETPLVRLARSRGGRAAGGLGMLLHQGALSFEIWTGSDAPLEVMREALIQAARRVSGRD